MHGRGEGYVLDNLECLDNDGYLFEGEEEWYDPLGVNKEEDTEGVRGGDVNNYGEADRYGEGGKQHDN